MIWQLEDQGDDFRGQIIVKSRPFILKSRPAILLAVLRPLRCLGFTAPAAAIDEVLGRGGRTATWIAAT